jgi:hypothetical protein
MNCQALGLKTKLKGLALNMCMQRLVNMTHPNEKMCKLFKYVFIKIYLVRFVNVHYLAQKHLIKGCRSGIRYVLIMVFIQES